MRILFLLALFIVSSASQSKRSPDQDLKIVTLREAEGKLRLYTQVLSAPLPVGGRPPTTQALPRTKLVRDAEGRVISAVGFCAWEQSGVIRLRVFKVVPAEGSPNEYLFHLPDFWSRLQSLELATHTTPLNKMIDLPELKPVGLGIVKARLELGVPQK